MSADVQQGVHGNDILKSESEHWKALYEQEKEQLEEFQRYSKELETEMDMELAVAKKKNTELENRNRKLTSELEDFKLRSEKERQEFVTSENLLRSQLSASEETCRELKQKLRRIEQANDDLERRERIHTQELMDWANRYEKCLERCAYLETGMLSSEELKANLTDLNSTGGSSAEVASSDIVMADRTLSSEAVTSTPTSVAVTGERFSFDQNATSSSSSSTTVIGSSAITPTRIAGYRRVGGASGDEGAVDKRKLLHNNNHHPSSTSPSQILNGVGAGSVAGYHNRFGLSGGRSTGITHIPSPTSPPGGGHRGALYQIHERPSAAIVTSLFRKIEEVEKHVDPKKFIIHRTPNHHHQNRKQ